jgi:hypothetical protein
MAENMPPRFTERNPETAARFRRESWWQIIFPVVAVTLLLIAGAVLMLVLGGPSATSVVADYALGLLVVLTLIGGLIALGLVAALAYGISKLIGGMPPYTFAVQQFMQRIYEWVDRQTNRLARAVIIFRSAVTGMLFYLRAQGLIPAAEAGQPAPESQPSAPPVEPVL